MSCRTLQLYTCGICSVERVAEKYENNRKLLIDETGETDRNYSEICVECLTSIKEHIELLGNEKVYQVKIIEEGQEGYNE